MFREFLKQIIDFDKKFLIIGNINCVGYKEVFPLIKENKIWLGNGMGRWISGFIVPNEYELYGDEVKRLFAEADVIITNPPFSLFREFLKQILDFEKKFLIIGNINCITYKEVFPLIMQNKIWIGPSIHSGDRKFFVPENYPLNAATCGIDEEGRRFINVKGVRWFTNLEHGRRHQPLRLMTLKDNIKYSHHKEIKNIGYKNYDNYDAIEVPFTDAIPRDYDGVMGVPITFLDKYCPEQFEILGLIADKRNENPAFIRGTPTYLDDGHKNYVGAIVNGKATYARVLIRRK